MHHTKFIVKLLADLIGVAVFCLIVPIFPEENT
jgi:hypothetical protein